MSKRLKIEPGRFFAAPLLGGGYAYGYFTYVNPKLMYVCDVFDRIGTSPEVPEDITEHPLIVRDLRIGGSEFRIRPADAARAGKAWVLSPRVMPGEIVPNNRYYLLGVTGREDVIDILDEHPRRAATREEAARLCFPGFRFPPTTTNMIEVAIRRLRVDPFDYRPKKKLAKN